MLNMLIKYTEIPTSLIQQQLNNHETTWKDAIS